MAIKAAGNPFVHLELNTKDPAKAKAFYSKLFGWEFSDNDMGPMGVYSTFRPAEAPGGGLFTAPQGPPGWMAYVGVEDVNASTEKAKSLGATIHMGPQEIPNIGTMTVLSDPTGCTIAMFQAAPNYQPQ